MPRVISNYKAPFWARSGHLQTIYPSLYRKVPLLTGMRERIRTPDNDFLDLDWSKAHPNKRLVMITHGLEGHSRAHYIQGMARAFDRAKWNVLAWNFRSCSGEPNTQPHSYHSGSSDELELILQHVFATTDYEEIALVGFSLGGNLMLKLLGDSGTSLDPRIRAAVALSVPCDLASSAKRLEHWSNRIYMRRFMNFLRPKVREKIERFPELIKDHGLDDMKTFAQFDDAYTAPIHGFKNAAEYWEQCSCQTRLDTIHIPTLLINALDDPFLTPSCFPHEPADRNPKFHLETPRYGGHCGFLQFNKDNEYWSESRSVEFVESIAP